MRELIGRRCACVFDLPGHEWPIAGYPAWVYVVDVDMPMVSMKSSFHGNPIWVNAATIKTIQPSDSHYSEAFDQWWKNNADDFGGGVRYKFAAWQAWEVSRLTAERNTAHPKNSSQEKT